MAYLLCSAIKEGIVNFKQFEFHLLLYIEKIDRIQLSSQSYFRKFQIISKLMLVI